MNRLATRCNLYLYESLIATQWNNTITILLHKKGDQKQTERTSWIPVCHLQTVTGLIVKSTEF